MADGSHLGFIQKPVTFEPFEITKPNLVSGQPRIQPDFEIFSFLEIKMADGSHLGFIQKPVIFEPFEITKPNLVSRLSTNPEFSQILKFSVF